MQTLIMISDPQGKQRLIEQANIYISIDFPGSIEFSTKRKAQNFQLPYN